MTTSLMGQTTGQTGEKKMIAPNRPPRLDFGLTATFCVPICSKHSARLHFEDSKRSLQFMNGLFDFGVFANFVLQSLQQAMRPCTCSAACRAPESGLDSPCVSMA
jgi:hypothetical protein